MADIHLIEKLTGGLPPIKKIAGQDNTYESGFWTLSLERAETLVNGRIFFHENQLAPSFFGGKITMVRECSEGQYEGKIIFTFIALPDCKNIKTCKGGWAQEMKIVM